MNETERKRRIMVLKRARLRLEARASFPHFLCYNNPKYDMEWFHRVIAEHCQALFDGRIRNLMVFVPPQHGKQLADSTLVPTPKGFVRHGDIKVGDHVFGADGEPIMVIAVSDKTQSEYRVTFSDGSTFDCHGNHEWMVYDRSYRMDRNLETKYMATQKLFSGTKGKRGCHYRFQVSPTVCVQFAPIEVSVDPYTLGVWLGDGKSSAPQVTIGNGDVEIIQKIPYKPTSQWIQQSTGVEYYYYGSQMNLSAYGLLNNKHIPKEYIFNSVECRKELIAGLIDTDGYVYQRNGRVTISNTNKAIIDDAALILRSLGQSTTVSEYEPKESSSGIVGKRKVYQLCFNPTTDFPTVVPRKRIERTIANRRRAIVSIKKVDGLEMGNCIQVEGGVYLVGDTFIPTHNSEIISRNFPAWALGQDPDIKIAGCSYSSDLASQFSRSIQRIIDSKEYQDIFPDTYLNGTNEKTPSRGYLRNVDIFETVGHRGFYKAVGVGGSLTGTPVDIAIIDDPVKDASEAYSQVYRDRVWDWYNTVLTTRLHNGSKQLFIMTRWHEDDLAGRILKTEPEQWTVLSIPAICEEDGDGGLSCRKIGDPLWPDRHSIDKLLKQRQRSPSEFSALYQQKPVIDGGNIIKREWYRRISLAEFTALRYHEPIHFFVDTAYNEKRSNRDNDPTGILAACRIGNSVYITDAQKVYKEMPELLKFIPEYLAAHDYSDESIVHIEPKANGESVVQMFERLSTINVMRTAPPTDSKVVRAKAFSPRVECGRVYLVEGSWNEEYLAEVCAFPNAAHDEYVDITGYAIAYLFDSYDDTDYSDWTKESLGLR